MKSGSAGAGAFRRICGIDESGRGPVLGPLVIAAVVVPAELCQSLRDMGVRDSKTLSSSKRASLYAFLSSHADIVCASTHISSQEIDLRRRRSESLNDIEASAMLVLARRLHRQAGFDLLQLDSVESNAERFVQPFRASLAVPVVAECGADATFVAVSAASVVAKVERDGAVAELERAEGRSLGSGYPADPATKEFLTQFFKTHGCLPAYIRHSWNIKKSSYSSSS